MKIFKGIHDQTKYEVIITPDCPIKDRFEKEVRQLNWELIGENEHWTLDPINYKKLLTIIEEERNARLLHPASIRSGLQGS